MFTVPPIACQQVQRQQERPSLTSTTNTSRLTSTANTSRSTSTANTRKGTTTNAPQRRSALGGFVFMGNGRTGIQLANHAAEIIKLLQLAGAHPSRWEGTLGHNNQTPWVHWECLTKFPCLFCFDIFLLHQIKQEFYTIGVTWMTNLVLLTKMFLHGHCNFFVCLNHSKICLLLPPMLLRLGVKGAVVCLV